MALIIRREYCTDCGLCIKTCPFGALSLSDGVPEVNAACRLCGLCVKSCPSQVFVLEKAEPKLDPARWKGFLVVAEQSEGVLHPVTLELLGQSLKLAAPSGEPVAAMVIGHGVGEAAGQLIAHGASRVYVYDDPGYRYYRVDAYAGGGRRRDRQDAPFSRAGGLHRDRPVRWPRAWLRGWEQA